MTRFTDGGISLGMSYTHIVADGKSLWDFMAAWGECARGGRVGTTTLPPIHERERLALQGPPSEEEAEKLSAALQLKCAEEVKDDKKEEEEVGEGQPTPLCCDRREASRRYI